MVFLLDYIHNELPLDEQKIALDFVEYLEKETLDFVKGNEYWKDKIYYLIKYKGQAKHLPLKTGILPLSVQ